MAYGLSKKRVVIFVGHVVGEECDSYITQQAIEVGAVDTIALSQEDIHAIEKMIQRYGRFYISRKEYDVLRKEYNCSIVHVENTVGLSIHPREKNEDSTIRSTYRG